MARINALTAQLRRRQAGYGRGRRMAIESDRAEALSGIRRGVSSGALEHGRLMSDAERLIVRFQQQVAEALAGSASTAEAADATFA